MATQREPSVAIIGAGMSGICMAIKLREAGVKDVVLYESGDDVGGTWRDNRYPGLECDVPSRLYQYSFAYNPSWSRFFAPGAEIHRYFRRVAHDYGVTPLVQFNTTVEQARYDGGRWEITTSTGQHTTVDFLISATGVLRVPRYPQIPGLTDFDGPVMHSARWDHTVDITDRRIGLIGNGSTGIQILSALQPIAGQVNVFQRSAQWVVPIPNGKTSPVTRLLHRGIPGLTALQYFAELQIFEFFAIALTRPGLHRAAITGLSRAALRLIRDPELRTALTPDYDPMCRRLVVSGKYHRAIQQPNMRVITTGIDHIEQRGVITTDGQLHELDALVLATGFDSHQYMRPMNVIGPGGTTIDETWGDSPRAHLSVGVPGFPNFFLVMGPHSPVGNYPLIPIAEWQTAHITRWITRWRDGDIDSVAPSPDATRAFNDELQTAAPSTIWSSGCSSWYVGKDGALEIWPLLPRDHRDRLAVEPDPNEYTITTGADVSESDVR